jgi:hypothetical protein
MAWHERGRPVTRVTPSFIGGPPHSFPPVVRHRRRKKSQFFALVARHPETGGRDREGRMLANVFSNTTTTPRVEEAEGVPLLGLALSLCLMAAIAALAFVACAAL